jgi:hypothetical protein
MKVMDILVFVAGVLVGMGGMWLLRRKNKTGDSKGNRMPAGLEITLNDIIHLASLNSISDLNALMIEYRIPVKYPVFYEKYQMLSKQEKDFYFSELVTVCAGNRKDEILDLYERYPGLSTQDVLLWLMMEIHTDNKTISRILGIQAEALKKRKARLKLKMQPEH